MNKQVVGKTIIRISVGNLKPGGLWGQNLFSSSSAVRAIERSAGRMYALLLILSENTV